MPSVSDRFVIGQRLELRVEGHWYASRLEDASPAQLTIAWPMDRERRLVPLKPGDVLEMAASSRDALYSASVKVVEAVHESVPLVTLQVGEWQRSQRREAVRLPVAIRPRVALRLNDDGEEPLRVGITNISATGLQLRSQDQLRVGDPIELTFELMDDELAISARVRRVEQIERVWQAGCQFEDVPDRTTKKIMQFIFAQQRAEIARMRKAS